MSLAVVLAMAASLLAILAVPAHAAAGANIVWLNPTCATASPACPSGTPQALSSRDGLLAQLTVAADGGDDWSAATSAYFYARNPLLGISANWHLLGVDSTPAAPDALISLAGFVPRAAPAVANGTDPNQYKAFQIDVNTAAMPGGISSTVDLHVVVCGSGRTSLDGAGGFDLQDHNLVNPVGILPINDCSQDGAATIGFDTLGGVTIDNARPVIRGVDYPTAGYHGDALTATNATLRWTTTADADNVIVSLCEGVNPDAGAPGTISTFFGGPGCLFDGLVAGFGALGGPTQWSLTFSTTGAPGTVPFPAGIVNADAIRVEAVVTIGAPFPGLAATATQTNYLNYFSIGSFMTNQIKAIWDYDNAPGDRTCQSGSSAATSPILPWSTTDADGDGAEGLGTAPAPAAGIRDIDDADNPVLKVCVAGTTNFSVPLPGIQVAWEVVQGPGAIDADTPSYRDPGMFLCAAGTPGCSGGFGTIGAAVTDGYARPGSVMDAPLADPLGRGTERICVLSCQRGDITNGTDTGAGLFAVEIGTDHAQVNSAETGTTTYRVCVDGNGDLRCDAGELSALATMAWTPGGRNHNHVWRTGTAAADGHSGVSTVPAPAGSTVSITGFFHDAGHNAVAGAPAIWRIGLNAPGHFVSTQTTTAADGSAVAVIGSSVLDAARTTPVFFCGDGDADGICDATPAVIEINWGGVVTSTSITGFAVNPTIGVFGTDFVATGTLLDGASAPVSSATVQLQRRTLGSNDWVTIRDIITNGTGAFSATDVDLAFNSDYRAVFAGNVSYTGSTSNSDRAWVRVGIAMNVSDPTVFSGQGVRISGRVLPAHPGDVVTLQVLDNGRGWKNIASARLSSASTYAFSVTHHSSKSLIFRVTYPTQGILNAWNVSRNARVTWA